MAPKRKRAASNITKIPSASNAEPIPQPSSRDASEEDVEDPVLQEVTNLKQKQELSTASSKRDLSLRKSNDQLPEIKVSVELEPVSINVDNELGMTMPPVPQAGLVDPAGGYHTNPPPTDRPVRIYADGVFDLFHLGHMRVLEQAKKAFPNTHLTVGVTGDEDTFKRKGRTVLSARERAESVRHCRWVDAVIEDCPWVLTQEFLEEHQFDYVAHDDLPYGAAEGDDIYAPIKRAGQFLVTQRTDGVSTTGIITKIVRDYEQYIKRQLDRGTSRQELNISWLKKNELQLKRHVNELRDSIRENWITTGQEVGREIRSLFPVSRPTSRPVSRTASPPVEQARLTTGTDGDNAAAATPISVVNRLLNQIETPRNRSGNTTPTERSSRRSYNDFAIGYSLGLVGGVKSWMTGSRRSGRDGHQSDSPGVGNASDDELPESFGVGESGMDSENGRKKRKTIPT